MAYASLQDAAENGWEVERTYLCQAHVDTNASASLNQNGLYTCYTCGDAGKLNMDDIHYTPEGVKKAVDRVIETLYPVRKTYSEGWLSIFDGDGPGDYWLSRFDLRTCEHFRLGRTCERSTYPLRGGNGEVLGVVYRNSHNRPKYEYPPGVKVSHQLFDIHRLDSTDLILTEGATDAIACWEVGVPAATSSYRNGLSAVQVKKIRRYNPRVLWIAYDKDRAGDMGYQKIKGLFDDVLVKRLRWSGEDKDLASMSLEFRKAALDEVLI